MIVSNCFKASTTVKSWASEILIDGTIKWREAMNTTVCRTFCCCIRSNAFAAATESDQGIFRGKFSNLTSAQRYKKQPAAMFPNVSVLALETHCVHLQICTIQVVSASSRLKVSSERFFEATALIFICAGLFKVVFFWSCLPCICCAAWFDRVTSKLIAHWLQNR